MTRASPVAASAAFAVAGVARLALAAMEACVAAASAHVVVLSTIGTGIVFALLAAATAASVARDAAALRRRIRP